MVFANQEGRFLISFSNFGGRTFSHLLILTFGSGGVGVIGIPCHFRTQFPLSASGKSVVGLLLRRRSLYPAELRVHVPENSVFSRVFRDLIVMISFGFLLTDRPVFGLSY